MASAEVDQKALGNFAAITGLENPFLSAMLYKILGLSVMLSNKLLRARRLRRLDPTRETKSLQLYYHIIWLSREGLLILEEFVLPMVEGYVELKILAYKLRASFYHIFVLFHNQPAIHSPGITTSISSTGTVPNDGREAESEQQAPREQQTSRLSFRGKNEVLTVPTKPPNTTSSSSEPDATRTKTTATAPQAPPGLTINYSHSNTLAPVQPPPPRPISSSFLLPALDYTPTATACFNHAALLAERFLPGSHPLRLSIKLEYAAYLYDCLQDAAASRKLAKQAIADVYNAQEGMDDESFEDAAEIVGLLGKMVKRGAKKSTSKSTSGGSQGGGGGGGSSTTRSMSVTPRAESSRTRSEGNRTPTAGVRKHASASPRTAATTPMPVSPRTPKASAIPTTVNMGYSPAAVPDPTMINPI